MTNQLIITQLTDAECRSIHKLIVLILWPATSVFLVHSPHFC